MKVVLRVIFKKRHSVSVDFSFVDRKKIMFNFLGLRKDSKKSSEKEQDGGFVIIGEIYIVSIMVMVWCV